MGGAHERGARRGPSGVGRTAEEPGQTANVDLCFVPATQAVEQRLPAVSGSSGRLVVTPVRETEEEHTWPGQVFEDPDVAYAEGLSAMEYLVSQFGRPAVRSVLDLMAQNYNFENAFKTALKRNVPEFDAAWQQDLTR